MSTRQVAHGLAFDPLVLTLLCYLSGFVIANLYLGSLGVVNVDMLRTRYIQVGLLFLLFLGAISLLIYGLLETLRSCNRESPWRALRRVVGASLQRLAMRSRSVGDGWRLRSTKAISGRPH